MLGERVIENCVSKLVLYMRQGVQYMGFPLDDYGKLVAYICAQNRGTPDHNKVNSFQGTSAEKHLSSCNQGICNSSSVNQSLKSGHVCSQQWRGRKIGEGKSRMKKEKLANSPNLDASYEMHQNKKPKMNSKFSIEETISWFGDFINHSRLLMIILSSCNFCFCISVSYTL
ncbi:uncharacterized protein LOC8263872 isoform X2 [Ricinus communis]|uniref:uncharacterized protein LOC8263872 isoform X2 n=1 Tax=Ricinus communis TaxID=3988 RepID=UPI00201AD82B|nr:uncharacterized protein LOC8263872 isoform X2 [Ricinus communis]